VCYESEKRGHSTHRRAVESAFLALVAPVGISTGAKLTHPADRKLTQGELLIFAPVIVD
jgi:hypothetical protein